VSTIGTLIDQIRAIQPELLVVTTYYLGHYLSEALQARLDRRRRTRWAKDFEKASASRP
jgi:hypothetical protein